MFQGCEDRLAPVAVIPMHTPEEACEELRHVKARGFKAVLIPGHVERKLPDGRGRLDFLGIDSAHDYDPFFKLCLKEQVSVSTHDLLRNVSPSSFVFNHIGQFSNSHLAFAKALFLGGVVRRNPKLKIAYLEGGVGWAFNLVWALIEHWEKRNPEALELYRPERVDYSKLAGLFREYGGKLASLDESVVTGFRHFGDAPPDAESPVDEFALAGIDSKQAVIDALSNHLYVGCEGEDRSVTLAFHRKALPKGIPLNVMFGSDVGHWDEPDITEVVAETHELVEKGLLSPEEFEAFTLTNAVRFYGGSNPAFFRGTALESVAEKILAAPADRRAGA